MNRLILLALLLFSVPAWATQYYVSNTGSDSANGLTLGTAWLTIGHANSTLVAGDTVDIVAGSYPESITKGNSGSAGLPITYEAYQGGTVIMDGSETPAGWTLDTGSIYKVTSWSPPYAGFVWQDNYTFLTSEASEGARCAGLTVEHRCLRDAGLQCAVFVDTVKRTSNLSVAENGMNRERANG